MSSDLHDLSRLPPGYRFVRELTRGSAARTVQAVGPDGEVVLRLAASDPSNLESVRELRVLAALAGPGLAGLVDHGAIDERTSFVARRYVEGVDLATYARDLALRGEERARALAAIVARVCEPLAALHRAGFVHADLKAENVIVGGDGNPTLTDFGLARPTRGESGVESVAGSLYSVAPEVLLGGAATPRSDVFGLGILLVRLLVPEHASPAHFYARFPARDALAALDVATESLPEWSRDLCVSMLEREPYQRPADAASVGAALRARLGIDSAAPAALASVEWPLRLGRESFVADACARLGQETKDLRAEWWIFPAEEAVDLAAEDARLAAGLAGLKTTSVDLAAHRADTSAQLDSTAARLVELTRDRVVYTALATPKAARLLAHWIRTARQAHERKEAAPLALIVCATSAPDAGADQWVVREVPGAKVEDVRSLLERSVLEQSAARLDDCARWIHAETNGCAALIRARLERLRESGFFVAGDDRPRLRKGEWPTRLGHERGDGALSRASADARLLAAAIAAHDEPVSLARAIDVSGLSRAASARALEELVQARALVRDARQGWVSLCGDARALRLDPAAWRTVSARIAADLRARSASGFESLPHEWRAADSNARSDVVTACVTFVRESLEQGAVERALDFLARLERAAVALDQELEPAILGEGALAWIAAGSVDRALSTAEVLERDAADPVRALAARIRGSAALQRAEYDEALAFLERADALDAQAFGTIAIARARVLFDARRDTELDVHVSASLENARTSARERANLLTLVAMSRARRGDVDAARALLLEVSRVAPAASDPLREAALALNLSTLERRRGDLDAAVTLAERGAACYEAIGFLPGIAQARVLSGALLRELGRLKEAQSVLENAALVRQRLGDHAGSAAARGMFGLVLADRGHVRASLTELERAASELKRMSRNVDAALFEAKVEELRARIGEPITPGERARMKSQARALDADPRALLSRARAAWMRRDLESARSLATRARDLARGLQHGLAEREADLVVREIECKPRPRTLSGIDGDERVLALLGVLGEPADARALASSLSSLGRDDRAARLFYALAARARVNVESKQDLSQAEAHFELCARGLLPREAEAMKKTLLSMPDPFPLDFTTLAAHVSDEEDMSMDVLALLEINRRLVAQEALPELLGAIVDSALHVTGAERGFVVLAEDGEIAIQTAMDSRRGDIAAPEVELSHSIVRQALQGSGVLRFSNAAEDPDLAGAASVVALDLRSILCAPFDIESGVRGVVYVDHRLKKGAFDERAERLLGLLADQAALAVRQVRRVAEIKRLNRELEREVVHKESDLRAAREALRAASIVPPASGLVGESASMRLVHEWIAKAAPSKLPVLVTGASGTGKELTARALHAQSARASGPFIAENCAALPAALIEAELFGYKKGAYTGADSDRTGLFERASGGTLFLDEIGELPLELQAKLLRVLETGEVRRIGDSVVRKTDVRLVAATNRDLDREVQENRFRADLLYRLDALRVAMPTLDDRVEDIPRLVDHFLRLEESKSGVNRRIDPVVLQRLCARRWPGNVRELSNEVARLCVLSSGDIVDPDLVRTPSSSAPSSTLALSGRTLAEIERDAIRAAITAAHGDKTKAAEMLGISRAKVYQRVKEWREEDSGATSIS